MLRVLISVVFWGLTPPTAPTLLHFSWMWVQNLHRKNCCAGSHLMEVLSRLPHIYLLRSNSNNICSSSEKQLISIHLYMWARLVSVSQEDRSSWMTVIVPKASRHEGSTKINLVFVEETIEPVYQWKPSDLKALLSNDWWLLPNNCILYN